MTTPTPREALAEREKFEAWKRARPNPLEFIDSFEAWMARAALAVPPGSPARTLTYTELTGAVPSAHRMDDEDWISVQRKFCEVNGLTIKEDKHHG